MFDNRSDLFLFKYAVRLEEIVKTICEIAFDIGKQLEEVIEITDQTMGFSIVDMFTETFVKEINVRPEELSDRISEQDGEEIKGLSNEDFFIKIAFFYNNNLFADKDFLSYLEGSDLLLINTKEAYFLCMGERAKDRLVPALKNAKILRKIISNLKSEKIKASLKNIEVFENDIFYRGAIHTTKQEIQPLLQLIKFAILNKDLITIIEAEIEDYWVNFSKYEEAKITLSTEEETFFLIKDKDTDSILGLLIKDNLLLYASPDIARYIKDEEIANYYWLLLENTYGVKPAIPAGKMDQGVKNFKALCTDVELNQLLSNLQNNLYIKDKTKINQKFTDFFNDVVILDSLDFLDNYSFLMSSNQADETVLGVYSSEKKGSSYNLLHWLNHDGPEKIKHYRSTTIITEKKKSIIHALKPAICYYFLEKYFEDLFEEILKAKGYEYLANRNLYENGTATCEIDFLVKTSKKIYYFETKTKLTKFYIDDFLKKSSKMMEKFKPMIEQGINFEFILLGGYSDANVNDYKYFIKDVTMNEVVYNVIRENLNGKPYFFTVPIPDREGQEITCIAEPEYDKLQNLLLEICQK